MADNTNVGPAPGEGVRVAETGLGRYQVEALTASAAFLIDEPASVGGRGGSPNPYDLLGAALGSCTAMTLRLYANRKGWPLSRVQVQVTHRGATLAARGQFERTITLEGTLDDAQRAKLLEIAEKCPVHLTLERGADVKTRVCDAADQAPPPAEPQEHMREMIEACA